jgi:hypothetical protein
MNKEKLLLEFKEIHNKLKNTPLYDEEKAHYDADDLLIQFINDKEIEEAFDSIHKWYA